MARLLCIGDSNTWGYDPRSRLGGRYPPDVRWTGRLPGWDVRNDGINGRMIPAAREYPDTERLLSSEGLAAVNVMLGTNDLLQGASAEEAGQAMGAFMRSLLTASGPARVILTAPPPFRYGEWVTSPRQIEESEKLAGVYALLAHDLGVSFADAGQWGIELAFDGVHFTPRGHAAFAEGLSAVLNCMQI